MRNLQEALAFAVAERRSGRQRWYRLCLAFVRQCWGFKASGIPSAIVMWRDHTELKRTDRNPKVGALVFWSGGTWGHVALYAGNGRIHSNDIKRRGKIDLVPMGDIEREWGFRYLGWAEDYNGTRLPLDDDKIKIGDKVEVTVDVLNARDAPGLNADVVSTANDGYKIKIERLKTKDGIVWGRGKTFWYALGRGGKSYVRKVK